MPITAFVRIRSTKSGHFLRCRECRARRARERYQTDPIEREKQKRACVAIGPSGVLHPWSADKREAAAERPTQLSAT
jgi:hypothetical protein